MECRFHLILKVYLGFLHDSAQCLSLLTKADYYIPTVYIILLSPYLSVLADLIQRSEEMQGNA